jgi:hypothetical protein
MSGGTAESDTGLVLCDCRLLQCCADVPCKLLSIIVGPEMDEEEPRILVKHVAVDRRHLDVAGAQRTDQGILTSSPVTRKSPVMAALPALVG